MITGELKAQVDKIWEAFWTGGITNPMSVIEQFTYLLFIRRIDEIQLREEKKANMIGTSIKNPMFTETQKELRWNYFKGLEAENMFKLFTETTQERPLTVFDHLKSLGTKGGVFTQYMAGATFLIWSPRLLVKVVDMIDKIKMDNGDTKGDLYEYMLSKLASAGANGQFRTPRHIINMMVEMTAPKKDDIICDPSCGTAGFLVSAGEYIHNKHQDWFMEKEFREHYNNEMFHGLESDSGMVKIAAMNTQLHGMENPKLIKTDSLGKENEIRERYSLVLANPPFKGSLDYDNVEPSILKMVKTKKTELLFLGLMFRMMKVGGRCAVIIPDGVLFCSSKAHKQIRQEIIEKHKLEAVIFMPSGVFKPYAGVSTAVLFFTKTNSGCTDNVWFYNMEADGYSLDDKRAEIKNNDIPDIISRFKALDKEVDRKRTDKSFFVPVTEIEKNDWDLSINRYKEIVYEEVPTVVSESYLSYLNRYNNNLVQFSKAEEIDLDIDYTLFKALFKKYIYPEESFETIINLENVFTTFRNKFKKSAAQYANINFNATKNIVKDLIVPLNVEAFGKNGSYFASKSFNFCKTQNNFKVIFLLTCI